MTIILVNVVLLQLIGAVSLDGGTVFMPGPSAAGNLPSLVPAIDAKSKLAFSEAVVSLVTKSTLQL